MDARSAALESALAAQLKGCCFARPGSGIYERAGGGGLQAFSVCDSTMDRAHALARDGAEEGMLVFAASQTRGRGRLGRPWDSPEGGAYFSVVLRPSRPLADIPQLSLVAGLAAAEALRELTGLIPSIRWPNDLLLGGRKVAGLLVEAKDGAVVLGMGINVTTDLAQLPDTATSLAAGGAACSPYEVVAAICRHLDRWYDSWTAQGFAPIRQALRPWLTIGQIVRLTTNMSQTEGQAVDVDESGRLLVRLDSGLVRAFEVGEVALLR